MHPRSNAASLVLSHLTGRIFCTADVILAGLTVDVLTVASLMAVSIKLSPGTTVEGIAIFF